MHIRFKRKPRNPSGESLAAQVETVKLHESMESFLDVEDDDVLVYVDNLLRSCKQIGPLEPFSLMSRGEALAALNMLEGKQRVIESHLKTARALRTLLESKLADEGQPQ